jgi:hypothetical protein
MPRPSIDLEPFKAEIIRQFQNDISCALIEELEKQIKKGQIEGYGKELLHRHIRNQGFVIAR